MLTWIVNVLQYELTFFRVVVQQFNLTANRLTDIVQWIYLWEQKNKSPVLVCTQSAAKLHWVGGGEESSDEDDRIKVKVKSSKNPQGFKQNRQKSLDQNLTQ